MACPIAFCLTTCEGTRVNIPAVHRRRRSCEGSVRPRPSTARAIVLITVRHSLHAFFRSTAATCASICRSRCTNRARRKVARVDPGQLRSNVSIPKTPRAARTFRLKGKGLPKAPGTTVGPVRHHPDHAPDGNDANLRP